MRVIKVAFSVFVLSCVAFCRLAGAVEITPSDTIPPYDFVNDVLVLSSAGDTFSFDFVISNPMGVSARAFQATIGVSGPGTLAFDAASSEAVASAADYWVFGNSVGAGAIDLGGGNYQFGDSPDSPAIEVLIAGDIMARYAFTWGGTVGDYIFTIDLDTTESFVMDDSWFEQTLQFNAGQYPGDDSSFTLHIVPEPATLMLISLGSVALLRKRRVRS